MWSYFSIYQAMGFQGKMAGIFSSDAIYICRQYHSLYTEDLVPSDCFHLMPVVSSRLLFTFRVCIEVPICPSLGLIDLVEWHLLLLFPIKDTTKSVGEQLDGKACILSSTMQVQYLDCLQGDDSPREEWRSSQCHLFRHWVKTSISDLMFIFLIHLTSVKLWQGVSRWQLSL